MRIESPSRGQQLARWVGRPDVDLDMLIANLREHGSVRHFNTIVRGEYGVNDEVEISAVSLLTGEHPCYGFTIRNLCGRKSAQPRRPRELPRSVEQLTQLVGRVTSKELMRETTDAIERLCIEAVALFVYWRMTGRGLRPASVLAMLLPGACLLLALRAALTGASTMVLV